MTIPQTTDEIAAYVRKANRAHPQMADLSENIRSYYQSIPGQPGCTCGRSLACGNDVPDYAAIWTLGAALDAWAPTEDEQPQDERDGALADLATELDAANDNADEIADRAGKYREEIMRLRAQVRELEGAQVERDGDVRAVAALLRLGDTSFRGNWLTDYDDARSELEARFADRIAELNARDTKAGEQR